MSNRQGSSGRWRGRRRGGARRGNSRGQGPARSLLTAPLPAPPPPPASSSRLARRAPRRSARESGPRTGRQPSLLSLCQCTAHARHFGTSSRPSLTTAPLSTHTLRSAELTLTLDYNYSDYSDCANYSNIPHVLCDILLSDLIQISHKLTYSYQTRNICGQRL